MLKPADNEALWEGKDCPWFFQVSCRWPALWPDANFGGCASLCYRGFESGKRLKKRNIDAFRLLKTIGYFFLANFGEKISKCEGFEIYGI